MSEPRVDRSGVYRSRIDPFAGVVLASLALSVPACVGVGVWALGDSVGVAVSFFVSAAFLAGLIWLVAWPVAYTLEAEQLVIRFGVIRVRVPYRDIDEISPTRTLLAGPALSRDRLLIRYRGGEALVSPRDQADFLRELAARDPALALDGAHVRRRG